MKILAVGVSVRAMVESAVRSGFAMAAVDAFGDLDLKLIAEAYGLRRDFNVVYSAQALREAARQLSYHAVAYTSNLENHPQVLGQIAGGRLILGNSPDTLRSVRNWPPLFRRLREAGFSVPETIFDPDHRKIDNTRRWLIKPWRTGGGHSIRFLKGSRWPTSGFMLQEYVEGKPCSAVFLANGSDCVVLGASEQLIGEAAFGASGFRYCGNIVPLQELCAHTGSRSLLDEVRKIAVFLTREYGLMGLNGFDFILDANGIYLTEVNPRYSASMELIERAYNLPMFALHVETVLTGNLPGFCLEEALRLPGFFGKAIVFAEANAVARDTKGWLDNGARDVPEPGDKILKGSPICTVMAEGPNRATTFDGLVEKALWLKRAVYE